MTNKLDFISKRKVLFYAVCMAIGCLSNFRIETFASNYSGYGAGQGRTDVVNVNDYSTSSWDRFSYNYSFSSGAEYSIELGKHTPTDIVGRDESSENVRRNKDVAFIPPTYGIFSGELATERSNPYMAIADNNYTRVSSDPNELNIYDTLSQGVNSPDKGYQSVTSTSIGTEGTGVSATSTGSANVSSIPSESSANSSVDVYYSNIVSGEVNTQAMVYPDGTIGTLKIPKLGLSVKVYEGESLENMKKGVGHFEFTSSWDGNVGIAGHNGGSAGFFENIKDLYLGDEITFETHYGKRTYVVSSMVEISDSDYSTLGWSSENQLTLITCVQGAGNKRLSLTATQLR